jgi:hypothetical protein
MPTVGCLVCFKDVSPTALACPHCGDDRTEEVAKHKQYQAYRNSPAGMREEALIWKWTIIIVVGAFALAALYGYFIA